MLANDNEMVASACMLESGLKGAALLGWKWSPPPQMRKVKLEDIDIVSALKHLKQHEKHMVVESTEQALGKDRSWRRISPKHTP